MYIIKVFFNFTFALFISAIIFAIIPYFNYLESIKIENIVERAIPIQSTTKVALKQKEPPKAVKRPAAERTQQKSSTQMSIQRSNLVMDLGPASDNAASLNIASEGNAPLAFEEGETDIRAELLPGAPIPPYPAAAQAVGIKGRVLVEITVDEQGRIVNLEFLETPGSYGFEESIRETLKQWKFKPAMNDNVPVKIKIRQPFDY